MALRNSLDGRSIPSLFTRSRLMRRRIWVSLVVTLPAAALFALTKQTGVGDYATAIGERKTIDLADDSIITLTTQSHVQIRRPRNSLQVHVKVLGGEVLFRLRHNSARSVIVTAGDAQIDAIGTAFRVSCAPVIERRLSGSAQL